MHPILPLASAEAAPEIALGVAAEPIRIPPRVEKTARGKLGAALTTSKTRISRGIGR